MAENKKSFIAYVDWKETFDVLPDEYAGKLIKHLFAYVSDQHPASEDVLINASFANIKHTLKRDLSKYETIKKKRSLAGKISGDKRKQKGTKRTHVKSSEQTPTKRTDNVNGNDNVNDTVIVNEEKKKYSAFVSLFPHEYQKLCDEHGIKNATLFIEMLNNYKGSRGARYKSDYLAILSWVVDKAKKEGKYYQAEKLVMP